MISGLWCDPRTAAQVGCSLPFFLDAEAFVHDRARRRVLQVNLFPGFDDGLRGKCRQRRLVKTAQNEFFLAGIRIDLADRENSRDFCGR